MCWCVDAGVRFFGEIQGCGPFSGVGRFLLGYLLEFEDVVFVPQTFVFCWVILPVFLS